MSSKTEFFKGLPKQIEDAFPEYWDTDMAWSYLLMLHDLLLARLWTIAKNSNPSWSGTEIHRCARLSLLNFLSGLSGTNVIIFLALKEWLLGDMDKAENYISEWVKQGLINGASKTAIEELAKFAAAGERFIESPGHLKKAANINDRDAIIASEFQKLQATGLQKTTVYQRLSVRRGLTIRQLQRIIKKSKIENDISG